MPPQWYIQMGWLGAWVTVAGLFNTREEAMACAWNWQVMHDGWHVPLRFVRQATQPPKGEDTLQDIGIA